MSVWVFKCCVKHSIIPEVSHNNWYIFVGCTSVYPEGNLALNLVKEAVERVT